MGCPTAAFKRRLERIKALKYQDLPGMPRSWIDFIAGKYPELSVPDVPCNRKFLQTHRERVKRQMSRLDHPALVTAGENSVNKVPAFESILELRRSGSVAVVVDVEAAIFGGVLSQFLKCLTAVKVCRELAAHGIKAVPVFWIHAPRSPERNPAGPVRILDPKSEMHRLSLPTCDSAVPSGPGLPLDLMANLIGQIENIGRDSFDREILETLKAIYTRNATWSSACTDLFTELMRGWDLIAVDSEAAGFQSILHEAFLSFLQRFSRENPSKQRDHHRTVQTEGSASDYMETPAGCYIQSALLPVFARIVDPYEISAYGEIQPGFEARGLVPPIAWPACSATLIDARARKILEKYDVRLPELLKGKNEVLHRLEGRMVQSSVGARLDAVKTEVERNIEDLNEPGMDSKSFRKAKERCREHIVYQINKTKDRIEAAQREKQEVIRRQIHRACNLLAPDGIRQEEGLAGITFPLRYSRSILSFLYENLDIMKFEHQLICLE